MVPAYHVERPDYTVPTKELIFTGQFTSACMRGVKDGKSQELPLTCMPRNVGKSMNRSSPVTRTERAPRPKWVGSWAGLQDVAARKPLCVAEARSAPHTLSPVTWVLDPSDSDTGWQCRNWQCKLKLLFFSMQGRLSQRAETQVEVVVLFHAG